MEIVWLNLVCNYPCFSFDILNIRFPGAEILMITSAEDSQRMYGNDGNYPTIPTFEMFERIRKGPLGHLYPSTGLFNINKHDG